MALSMSETVTNTSFILGVVFFLHTALISRMISLTYIEYVISVKCCLLHGWFYPSCIFNWTCHGHSQANPLWPREAGSIAKALAWNMACFMRVSAMNALFKSFSLNAWHMKLNGTIASRFHNLYHRLNVVSNAWFLSHLCSGIMWSEMPGCDVVGK